MPVHTRNLVLFIALALAAVLTGIFARGPAEPDVASATERSPAEGYFLQQAKLDVTDDRGTVIYSIRADRVNQQPDTEDFVLDGIAVEYAAESNVHWGLTASRGNMNQDRSIFDLDDVRLFFTGNAGDQTVTFEASQMHLDARAMLASTDRLVVFRQGSSALQADGLSVNLEAETFELKNHVTSNF